MIRTIEIRRFEENHKTTKIKQISERVNCDIEYQISVEYNRIFEKIKKVLHLENLKEIWNRIRKR